MFKKGNKKLLYLVLPVVVVVPLLIASYFIGPVSIWLWAGIGLGMMYAAWQYKRQQKRRVERSKFETLELKPDEKTTN